VSFLGVVDCFQQSVAAGTYALRRAFPELKCDRPAVNVSKGMQGTLGGRVGEVKQACRPEVYEELRRITELDRRLVEEARLEIARRPVAGAATDRAATVKERSEHAGILRNFKAINRVFDTQFYLAQSPDVRAAGMNPLLHYLRYGAAEGRKPHRLFDPQYYRKCCIQPPGPGENTLAHFLSRGKDADCPHPLFDCDAYRASHPGLTVNPLLHYLKSARNERPATLRLEIGDVEVAASVSQDADGRTHWDAEPQQLPFLQALEINQARSNSR
jgi:hypothetical protein